MNEDDNEFFDLLGTDLKNKGWIVYYDQPGLIEGVESPDGEDPGTTNHYRKIKSCRELKKFLELHNRVDLYWPIIMPALYPETKIKRVYNTCKPKVEALVRRAPK